MSCSRNPGVTLTQMSNDPHFQQIVDAVQAIELIRRTISKQGVAEV